MVGDGQDVESVVPRLTHTLLGRNLAIGVYCMHMQVGFVAVVTIYLRNDNLGTTDLFFEKSFGIGPTLLLTASSPTPHGNRKIYGS